MITKYNEFLKEDHNLKPKDFGIDDYTYDKTNQAWNCHENIYLSEFKLNSLPFKFGKIIVTSRYSSDTGIFDCSESELTSLKWAPYYVQGDFSCYDNKLTSLEFSPTTVGGDFKCNRNNITSLKGCPEIINGDFSCYENKLTSLEYCPSEVKGDFIVSENLLSSLEGCPEIIRGDFNFSENPNIKTTEYFPKLIEGDLWAEGSLPIEEYPLDCIIKRRVRPSNVKFHYIFELIKSNSDILKPLMNDKIKFHQMVMRLNPDLIRFYTSITPPSKRTMLFI